MPSIRSNGWTVTLTHPTSDRTLRPDVLGDQIQFIPGPNTRPEIRVPIRRAPEWLESQFDDNPDMDVWLDGNKLPIDELVDVEQPEGRTVLVGEGGSELRTRVQAEYDSEERPVASTNLIDANTNYATVDNTPDSNTTTVDAQTLSGESELQSNITPSSTTPLVFTGGGIKPAEICFTKEGENFDSSNSQGITSQGAAYSNGSARGVDTTGDTVTWQFTPQYDIPAGELGISVRDDDGGAGDLADGIAAFEWRFEGELVEEFPSTGNLTVLSWSDLHNDPYSGPSWTSPALDAGTTYTITLECTDGGDASDTYVVDVIAPHDLRYRSNLTFDDDTSDSNGYLDGPELYAASVDAVFDAYQSAFNVIEGSATVDITDTSGDQALALSNDFGSTYPITASNSTTVSGSFPDPGGAINLKATLSRYSPNGTRDQTPREGYDAQRLDGFDLDATVEFESLLIDQEYDNDLTTVLNDILGEQFQWAVKNVDGTTTVEISEPGEQVADRDPDLSEAQISKRVQTYGSVTIKGSSLPVSGENFQASDTFVDLDEDLIVTGSEAVTDDTGRQYQRGVDYEINYRPGEIRALDGGDLTTSDTYAIDYHHRIRGTHNVAGVSGDELVETVPGVVSDRQAEQIAFVLAEVEPAVSTPRYEGDIVVPRVDATFDPLEALNLDDLDIPDPARPLSIRGTPEVTPLGLTLRLGSNPPLESSLAAIREQVSAVSDRV